jgi:hypothetical protein
MDRITQLTVAGASAAVGSESLYVDDVFSTYLYEGTGTTQTITNGIDLAGKGGLVWQKNRQLSSDHRLQDTERGLGNTLFSSTTAAQASESTLITSANSDGFTLGGYLGTSNIASWTFRKAPGFFDVVTYTGNGTAGRTVAHNLGSQPGMILVKKTNSAANWFVYHRSVGATKALRLNLTNAEDTSTTYWNDTEPTSTEFTVGTSTNTNGNGDSFVAYVFAHDDQSFGTNSDESVIKCGSYTGNGTTQEINLGWEPQWVLIKSSAGTTTNWHVFDNMRGINAGGNDPALLPDISNAENFSNNYFGQLTATGFELTSTLNGSGNTYIYMAIRRPHKPPTAATEVFSPHASRSATDTTPSELAFTGNFPVDLLFYTNRIGGTNSHSIVDRMRGGGKLLATASTAAEVTTDHRFDSNEGVYLGSTLSATSDYGGLLFKRAPGFFDVVAYEGTGSVQAVNHSLTVAPELMIIKNRDANGGWIVYVSSLGAGKNLKLQTDAAEDIDVNFFNNTEPTATQFSVGAISTTNGTGHNLIAYLFASLDGISKVGSYAGTESAQDIDCGFTGGARFVLIKCSDAGGTPWLLFDSARGITTGNDPYVLLNSTSAEGTADLIEPLSSGFSIANTADGSVNAIGRNYTYLAIA